MTGRSRVIWAHIALISAGAGWALTPVVIRMTNDVYDPFTLSFYRYALALGPLLAMSLVLYRRDFARALRNPVQIVPLAAIMIVEQWTWVEGLKGTPAATAHLIMKISVVFIIVLSYIAFQEERGVIRSPRFVLGTLTSFAGVALVLNPGQGEWLPRIDFYAFLVILTAVLWALYSVGGKHTVKGLHPVPMFTVLSLYTAGAYGVLAWLYGQPGLVLDLDAKTIGLTAAISIIPLSIAHPLFHHAQIVLGSSYCGTFNLFTPAITYGLALIALPGERLNPTQLLGAGVLLAGTFTVSLVRARTPEAEPCPLELPETVRVEQPSV